MAHYTCGITVDKKKESMIVSKIYSPMCEFHIWDVKNNLLQKCDYLDSIGTKGGKYDTEIPRVRE